MGELGSLKSLGSIGSAKADKEVVFEPSWEERWESAESLTPEHFAELEEKYGDRPEWLRISGYREGRSIRGHRRRSELMLNLRGKDYWFPLSPQVYEKFIDKITTEDRGKGLRYLQRYIRAYREYKEIWPSKRYVRRNRIDRDSFFPESDARSVTTAQVGLSQDVIDFILDARREGTPVREIARQVGVSRTQVESDLNAAGVETQRSINDELIDRLASGAMSVDEALDSASTAASERQKSLRVLRVMSRDKERQKSLRLPGMKPRSRKVRVTPSSL